jgi:hypothetical protein
MSGKKHGVEEGGEFRDLAPGPPLPSRPAVDTILAPHENRAMKNVTITLDEETARWARIEAARADTSVSRLVGQLLQRRMLDDQGYEAAMAQFLSAELVELKPRGGSYPKREELHDRTHLR